MNLFVAINCVTGFGIIFSGYYQARMAGVYSMRSSGVYNVDTHSQTHFQTTMAHGHTDASEEHGTVPTTSDVVLKICYRRTTIITRMDGFISDCAGRIRIVTIGCFCAIFGAAPQVMSLRCAVRSEGPLDSRRHPGGRYVLYSDLVSWQLYRN